GGIAEGTQRRQQRGHEDVNPLVGFALAHAEQPPLDYVEGVGLHIGENKQQPVLRGRQRTILVHANLAGGAGFPIKAPGSHMRLERALKGRDEELKLVECQAGEIQKLRGARLQIDKPYTGHEWCLLPWEAQYTINRDNLN